MTTYLSESLLRKYSSDVSIIITIINQTFKKSIGLSKPKVFLSHSRQDKDLILPVLGFLQDQGVDVFVDWLDQDMPDEVSGDTAQILKDKIKECQKFLLLVTENSKNSKWVPWELGVADGHKPMTSIAILPVDRNNAPFRGNEYLNIYPKLEIHDNRWIVWLSQPQIFKFLPDWLKQQ